MKRILLLALIFMTCLRMFAEQPQRRPVDSQHPMWLIHVDVWNKADPQKIIDLIPADIKPYVVMNLSLSCGYDTQRKVYKMPQNAMKTYKSWATICQHNGMWFTCQPASGGHTHIKDDDLETFEYMFKTFPNFLGWNFAEQFWGFDEPNDESSSTQTARIALFAKLVKMSHEYGGFLTISFCGNIWSHALNPVGMMKRNSDLLAACKAYPESILWLYKYTTSSCFYNNESVTWSPFVAGLASSYGVRYDNCGWNGALDALLGEKHGLKYPNAAGYGTVLEQTCVNGGAVWDGPELIWTEDFQNLSDTRDSYGYTKRNWGLFPGFKNGWIDMFGKIVDGTMYIPTREEVIQKTKIYIVNDLSSGNDEDRYAAWGDLYDGLYKQTDPFNRGNGQWMDNFCYFKKTGRYGAIPVGLAPYDDLAKTIPTIIKKSTRANRWSAQSKKVNEFNAAYPTDIKGDLYVNRYRNQLVTYTPYTYLNKNKTASATVPLHYNTCDTLGIKYGKLSTGIIHEYADHIDIYLNNYRADSLTSQTDAFTVIGATEKPTYTLKKRATATCTINEEWDETTHTYLLKAYHHGPVDISIKCSGTGVDRLTDVVSNTALESPAQPAPYYGPIVVEAEDMDYKSIKSCVTDPYNWYPNVFGHAGNGFMDMGTSRDGALRHVLKCKKEGTYRISIRYNNRNKEGNLAVQFGSLKKNAKVELTEANEWKKSSVEFNLRTGNNTINILNSNGISLYIDNVTYCPAEIEDEKYAIVIRNAAHGKVVAEADSAAEGAIVKLTVQPEEGYRLKAWNIIHGSVQLGVSNEVSFVMPDDNVIIEPIFEDTSLIYWLDFSNVLSGTIPAGWRTEQGSEVHEYPNSYSSGARTFNGFSGYQGKALYWREKNCEYGRQSAYRLELEPGDYKLTYAMAAWKGTPRYIARILDSANGVVVSSSDYLASPNADGNTAASIKNAVERTLEFTVTEKDTFFISFINAGSGFDEFLLVECNLNYKPVSQGIQETVFDASGIEEIYTVEGIKVNDFRAGLNIVRTQNGSTHKVMIK